MGPFGLPPDGPQVVRPGSDRLSEPRPVVPDLTPKIFTEGFCVDLISSRDLGSIVCLIHVHRQPGHPIGLPKAFYTRIPQRRDTLTGCRSICRTLTRHRVEQIAGAPSDPSAVRQRVGNLRRPSWRLKSAWISILTACGMLCRTRVCKSFTTARWGSSGRLMAS